MKKFSQITINSSRLQYLSLLNQDALQSEIWLHVVVGFLLMMDAWTCQWRGTKPWWQVSCYVLLKRGENKFAGLGLDILGGLMRIIVGDMDFKVVWVLKRVYYKQALNLSILKFIQSIKRNSWNQKVANWLKAKEGVVFIS